jgi:hypothetical protein
LTYTEVADVVSIGEYGGTANVPTYVPLKTGIVVKRVGSIDYGDAAIQMGRHMSDAGSVALKAGFDGANRGLVHSFKVTYADGGIDYFVAVISSFSSAVKEADGYRFANVALALTDSVVEVAAVAAGFTVTYIAGANGSIIGSAVQTVADGGDSTPVFASAAAGYEFTIWSDSSTDNPRNDEDVEANITVTASFALI